MSSCPPLATKAAFLDLYRDGKLGNRLAHWETVVDIRDAGYRGLVAIRVRRRDSPAMRANILTDDLPRVLADLCRQYKLTIGDFYFVVMHPGRRVFQGEVVDLPGTLNLRYALGHHDGLMPEALAERGRHAEGIAARLLLRHFFDAIAQGLLFELLDRYDGAAIEFTTYDRPVGIFHSNTVFWEVRQY